MDKPGTPVATYRVQFNRGFRFEDARRLVDYLDKLGVSDLYASPIFKARRGSGHGYDVTDPTRLNPELGTEADFEALVAELRHHNMGLLLDIVPNHMAASPENPWWQDVVEKGAGSAYAGFFDTDWLAYEPDESKVTGYRRFFDIGELVGVRVENREVFETSHSLILRLIAENRVTGLRIDHIDGLYRPLAYLRRLQQSIAGQRNNTGKKEEFFIVVEKILSGSETLPEEWPVAGTTGYDFTNVVNVLFLSSHGARELDTIYAHFTGSSAAFNDIVCRAKKKIMEESFTGELEALTDYLNRLIQEAGFLTRPAAQEMRETLLEVTVCLPVYRTYIAESEVSTHDRQYLERAFAEAKQCNSALPDTALELLRDILLLNLPDTLKPVTRQRWQNFVLRWQQLTGAVMAKGFEDTALYNYNRLLSLNEVGGNPDSSGLPVKNFHHLMQQRLDNWPQTLNASSTHDTKRSEDVRARINVLSEIPGEWQQALSRWSDWNQSKKQMVNGLPVPEPNTEYFIYQTLLGAWPLDKREVPDFKRRFKEYLVKALREAKDLTGWLSPDEDYEAAVLSFTDSILDETGQNRFLNDFLEFEKKPAFYGLLNSLSQVLLKITSPGIPDFYQGTELWDFSLVDPDNRRPVDFEKRQRLLDDLIHRQAENRHPPLVQQLVESWRDGVIKLYVIFKALNLRRDFSDLFKHGDYRPLQSAGGKRQHICAFARTDGDEWILTLVPRFVTGLTAAGDFPCGQKVWRNNRLLLPDDAPHRWWNVFTGETLGAPDGKKQLALAEIFNLFPVALLTSI